MAKAMVEEKLIDPRKGRAVLNNEGHEDHSKGGGPLAAALNLVQRDNLGDRVRDLIKSERLALDAAQAGYETFEEADDFNIADDDTFDPQTPYEEVFEGSVQEDMAARFEEQKAQLKNVKADKLKEFLSGMDATELAKAVQELGVIEAKTAAVEE